MPRGRATATVVLQLGYVRRPPERRRHEILVQQEVAGQAEYPRVRPNSKAELSRTHPGNSSRGSFALDSGIMVTSRWGEFFDLRMPVVGLGAGGFPSHSTATTTAGFFFSSSDLTRDARWEEAGSRRRHLLLHFLGRSLQPPELSLAARLTPPWPAAPPSAAAHCWPFVAR